MGYAKRVARVAGFVVGPGENPLQGLHRRPEKGEKPASHRMLLHPMSGQVQEKERKEREEREERREWREKRVFEGT